MQLPIGKQDTFKGIIDLLTMKAEMYEDDLGQNIHVEEIPEDLRDQAEELRDKICEVAAEGSDELMENTSTARN